MAKKGRKQGLHIEESPKFSPRHHAPHVAQEYYDSGSVEVGWSLVDKLRPWAQRAVIGTTRGAPTRV